jgi:hypothetical protein
MAGGSVFNRRFVVVLADGSVIYELGENCYQDLISGEFYDSVNQSGSHTILDEELAWLKRTAQIMDYDDMNVFVAGLPERPQRSIE